MKQLIALLAFSDVLIVLAAPEVTWSLMHPTVIDTNYIARVAAKAVEYGGVDSFEVCGDSHRGYSGERIVTVGKKGRDYPAVRSIALVR